MRARRYNNIQYGKPITEAQEFDLIPLKTDDKRNNPSLKDDTHILRVQIATAEGEDPSFLWIAAFPEKFQELADQIANQIPLTQDENHEEEPSPN